MTLLTGEDADRCPHCHEIMEFVYNDGVKNMYCWRCGTHNRFGIKRSAWDKFWN